MKRARLVGPAPTEAAAGTSASGRPVWDLVRESGLRSLVVGLSKDPNAKVTVLLVSERSRRPVLAVKVPTTDEAARAVEAEIRVLTQLRRLDAGHALAMVPRVVETANFEGRPALVMTALPGTPMTVPYLSRRHTATPSRVAADFDVVGEWLARLHEGTQQGESPLDMDAGLTDRLAMRFGDDPCLADDLGRLGDILGRLRAHVTLRTVVHGDLWLGNLLLSHGRISGVIDWEAGAGTGEPVRDLVRFAQMYALYLDRATRRGRRVTGHPGLRAGAQGAGLQYALEGTGWFPERFRRFIGDGLARLGASPAAWRDAALAGVAEVAAVADDEAFARLHLELFRRVNGGPPRRKEFR